MLAVRREDYVNEISPKPFVGLPREEIERLHGAIAVHALDHTDPAYLPLAAYAVIHYNYTWLVDLDGPGKLGKRTALHAAGEPPIFLDDAMHAVARAQLEAAGLPNAPAEWRCAGLAHHAGQLALVYVVRLQQRWAQSGHVIGNGELLTERSNYDALSQLLIEHVHAL